MAFSVPLSQRPRLAVVATTAALIIFAIVTLRVQSVRAGDPAGAPGCAPASVAFNAPAALAPQATKWVLDATPTTAWRSVGDIDRLCGQLVFLVDTATGLKTIGLKPCGPGKPYIFRIHPRDIVDYYQFREVDIYRGPKICTGEFGCLDKYIYTFKNYIGIKNCQDCGMNVPPTWTQVPLTPFTATPVPPTRTPYVPTPTATLTATPAPGDVTATAELFALLRGSPSPQASPEVPPQVPPEVPPAATPTPAAPAPAPTALAASSGSISQLIRSPLVIGIGFILVMLGLAYLVWLSVMGREE